MLQHEQKYYSPEEYLALDEAADYKSEYYAGEIFAMSGGSANHNRIARNLLITLEAAFENRLCETFINDMRLLVKANGLYTYPDITVVCGQIEFVEERNDTITNPIVIIKVLSKSTQDYDRGSKFTLYRAIETFQDYVLIDQARIIVEYFHKLDDGRWILQEFEHLDELLQIKSIGLEITRERIYHRVDWSE